MKELAAKTIVTCLSDAIVNETGAERVAVEADGVRGWVSVKVLSDAQRSKRAGDAVAAAPGAAAGATGQPSTGGGGATSPKRVTTTLHYREGQNADLHHSLKLTVPPKWLAEGAPLRRLTAAFCDNYNRKHGPKVRLEDASMRLTGRDGALLPFTGRVSYDLDEHLYVVPAPADEPAKTAPGGHVAAGGAGGDVGIPRRLPKPPAKKKMKTRALDADANNCYDLDDVVEEAVVEVGAGDGKTKEKATRLKDRGNAELAAKRYARAVELYDEALALEPAPVERLAAVLLANRAMALLSRVGAESCGGLRKAAVLAALRDAESNAREACEADAKYDKAFYRLGLANVEFARACAGGGVGAPLPDEVEARLREAVKALARAARISPKMKDMRVKHAEAKEALEEHEAALDQAALPPCYGGRPPIVESVSGDGDAADPAWIDKRVATTVPVERVRSGTVEKVIELPLLLKKQWNRNNRKELAVGMVVSDHYGSDAVKQSAANLGPAWTVGEGLYAGKRWGGGFLSIPDRTGVLAGAPKERFLLHPNALKAAQIDRLADLGLIALDVADPVTVRMDDQHDAITLRVCDCLF